MIIKLDSIEEESALMEDNPITKRSKSKNSNNNKMDEWNNELNRLEDKFKSF